MTTVYVAHLSHAYGHDIGVFSTEQKALHQVATWAREKWDENAVAGAIPDDDDTLIERYFEAVDEYYNIATAVMD